MSCNAGSLVVLPSAKAKSNNAVRGQRELRRKRQRILVGKVTRPNSMQYRPIALKNPPVLTINFMTINDNDDNNYHNHHFSQGTMQKRRRWCHMISTAKSDLNSFSSARNRFWNHFPQTKFKGRFDEEEQEGLFSLANAWMRMTSTL